MSNDIEQVMAAVPTEDVGDEAISKTLQGDIQKIVNEYISGEMKFDDIASLEEAHKLTLDNIQQLFNDGFIDGVNGVGEQMAAAIKAKDNYLLKFNQ